LRRRFGIDPAVIHNGADPELMDIDPATVAAVAAELLDPERVSLVYTGRFGSYGRDPRALVGAIAALARNHPDVAARFELVVAGPLTTDEDVLLRRTDVAPARIRVVGSLDRGRALALQKAADVLLLLANAGRT